jgi:glycosyltransferase involved in cell wall biosynthesis
VPQTEQRRALSVDHPRYPVIPGVGEAIAPVLLAAAVYRSISRLAKEFDLIDAHYFYPDGVAAVLIASRLRKPVVVTARGSDINLFSEHRLPRRWIRWAGGRSDAIIAVSEALRHKLDGLGIRTPIDVLRNGVDLKVFCPIAQIEARKRLGWGPGRVLLCVGKLDPVKGHATVVQALTQLEGCRLVIVGQGPSGERLRELADNLGVGERVSLVGEVAHSDLRTFYCASDALVHFSTREGMPNVVLESMACGTPVIATAVGGVAEIINEDAGILVHQHTAEALQMAVHRLFRCPPSVNSVRAHAETFAWSPTIQRQLALYRSLLQ